MKLTEKQKLRRFLVLKNKKIERVLFSKYATVEDIDHLIAMMTEEEAKKFNKIMLDMFEKEGFVADGYSCPWCYVYNDNCPDCSYGKKYGICMIIESKYSDMIEQVDEEGDYKIGDDVNLCDIYSIKQLLRKSRIK